VRLAGGRSADGVARMAWQSGAVTAPAADALLGLLSPAWQALIAGSLLVVTLLGIRRLMERGPARVTNAMLLTGALIVTLTVVGTLVVSCSNSGGQDGAASARTQR
jgi:hypothetical protein